MKKRWKRWLALGIVCAMLVGFSGISVFGMESTEEDPTEGTTESTTEEMTEGSTQGQLSTTEEEINPGDAILDATTYTLGYVYLEKTEIAPSEEQIIAVNIAGIPAVIEPQAICLGYQVNGREEIMVCSERKDDMLIFRQVLPEAGEYRLLYVAILSEAGRKDILLSDYQVEASFQVNADLVSCTGEEEPIYSGETPMAISMSEALPIRTGSGKVVVVLDPGHDSIHAGAAGNGLQEEILNLKIAQYCKEELEKYNNVVVYMTRNDGSCLDSRSNGYCMEARCRYAASVGADILVSIHVDAGSVTRSGGMVIVAANGVYRDDLSTVTHAIGEEILEELNAVGLGSRGLYVRMSDSPGEEYQYPNGAVADWYSITRNSIKQGISGIIVEHGFISNPSDAANWFRSDERLKVLGVADAKGIADYFGLVKRNTITDAMQENSNEAYTDSGENVSDFVAALYQQALGRTPSRSEVSWWVAKVEQDNLTGSGLARYFVNSEEFQSRNYNDEQYIDKLYEIFLGRAAEPEGKAYWIGRLRTGDSRIRVADLISRSGEFEQVCVRYGIAQGSHPMQYVKLYPRIADFVKEYYRGLMNREADPEGLEYWTKSLIVGDKTASDMTRGFINSQEFRNRNISSGDFVEGLYQTYLGRTSDPEGKTFWIGRLGNMSYQEKYSVIRGFICSDEYEKHCNSYGIAVGRF